MEKASLYQDLTYNDNKVAINVLFDTDFTKEIRILLKAGQAMKEHQSPFPIVVQIVEGKIDFGVSGVVQHLQKGDLVALEGNLRHDLQAVEDSVVRLTLTKMDNTARVKKVVD